MNKFLIPLLLSLILNPLYAKNIIFSTPKISLKMIDKKEITFINLDKSTLKIRKSKYLDIEVLKSSDILGRTSCSPFYVCSKKVEKYFSSLGIEPSQELVIYDDSYGINAATLYVILESMGHKKISILRGGLKDISKLDPNLKIYMEYLNQISLNTSVEKIKKITKKINILKSHLLLQDNNVSDMKNIESNYKIINTSVDYLVSKEKLKRLVKKAHIKELNITIIDACDIGGIVRSNNVTDMTGTKSLSWKELIDKKKRHLKSNKELEKLFKRLGLSKNDNNYIYCMSGAQKAFYVMMALRELGYDKVKAFTGDWNTWVGDIDE